MHSIFVLYLLTQNAKYALWKVNDWTRQACSPCNMLFVALEILKIRSLVQKLWAFCLCHCDNALFLFLFLHFFERSRSERFWRLLYYIVYSYNQGALDRAFFAIFAIFVFHNSHNYFRTFTFFDKCWVKLGELSWQWDGQGLYDHFDTKNLCF